MIDARAYDDPGVWEANLIWQHIFWPAGP